jgi:hypothetical protein
MTMLNELARAIAKAEVGVTTGHSMLVYGPPKAGKSALAATIAEAKDVDRVFFFDNENSWEVLLWMIREGKLTKEAASKINVIRIADSKDDPYAIDTMIKCLNSIRHPVYLNTSDGKVLAKRPLGDLPEHIIEFQMSKLTKRDVIITDSLSQLADSALSAACKGQPSDFKPGWDEYGLQGKWLSDCLAIIQQAKYTNFVCVTHEILLPDQDGVERFFPMCGTKNFCYKVAKYFGTVVSVGTKMRKHIAGSSSVYSDKKLTGSRRGVALEKMEKPSLAPFLEFDMDDMDDVEAVAVAPVAARPSGLLASRLAKK